MLSKSGADSGTKKLLALERRLFEEEDTDSYARTTEEIRGRLLATSFVRTSKELDEFLQLAMLYVVTLLPYKSEDGRKLTYKVSLAIHSARHDVLLIKPSFYYRGRCAALHPAASLSGDAPAGDRPIGQTGVSFLLGKALVCKRFGADPCPQYIKLRSHGELETTASLCIPLTATITRTVARLDEERDASGSCSVNCDLLRAAAGLVTLGGTSEVSNDHPSAVLNVEFHETPTITQRLRFVHDSRLSEILGHVHRTLTQHQQERDRYRTLKACTSLFDLAHHNFSPRGAYELLLRQVSKVCSGADVTLHVRDLGPEDDDRCIRLVEGVGRNFRGFLINDRQSIEYGVVGNEFRQLNDSNPTVRFAEQIDELLRTSSPNYRQLMPDTVLNMALAVPAADGGRPLAVLNIEWDREALARAAVSRTKDEAEQYINGVLATLRRIADYFGLVVEHFADDDALSESGGDLDNLREESDRRLWLSYHVDTSLKKLDSEASAPLQQPDFLGEIIHGAGYLLNAKRDLQFYLSYRRLEKNGVDDNGRLELVVAHGMGRPDAANAGIPPRSAIEIGAGDSVMATAAKTRLPIFGELHPDAVRSGFSLSPDADCEAELREKGVTQPIRYRSSGTIQPIYEVAVPVVLGGDLKGVVDFEQFKRNQVDNQERAALAERARLNRQQLVGFRQWARSISLCIGFSEDRSTGLYSAAPPDFRVFVNLVASIVANVRMPEELIAAVELELLQSLAPVVRAERQLLTSDSTASGDPERRSAGFSPQEALRRVRIRHRGETRGLLEVTLSPSTGGEVEGPLFPYAADSEAVDMALRFLASYKASLLASPDAWEKETEEFKVWLKGAEDVFDEEFEKLMQSEEGPLLDAGEVLLRIFELIHQSLEKARWLGGVAGGRGARESSYGWYVYHGAVRESTQEQIQYENYLTCRHGDDYHLSMQTEEARKVVLQIRNDWQPGDDWKERFRTLIERRGFAETSTRPVERGVRQVDGAQTRKPSDSEGMRELTWILGTEDYPRDDEKKGITSRTAATRKAQCYPDIVPSPYRSDKPVINLLFHDQPYTIISVPVTLEVAGKDLQTVGVINFLRRRDRVSDLGFFKAGEVEVAERLVKRVTDRLRQVIHAEAITLKRSTENGDTQRLWPSGERLVSKIEERLKGVTEGAPTKWVWVVTELAKSRAVLRAILRTRVPALKTFLETLNDPENLPITQDSSCVLFFPLSGTKQFDMRKIRDEHQQAILTLGSARPQVVFVVVSQDDLRDLEAWWPDETLPHYDHFTEEQQPEENWAFFSDLLADAGMRGGFERIDILTRSDGPCGSSEFKKLVTESGQGMSKRAKEVLGWQGRYRPYAHAVVFRGREEEQLRSERE